MTHKRPTQADVARAAGVSRATVSYVLNDVSGDRIPISAETRQRVQEVIAQMGYQVDARAQALRSGDTKTIGVMLPMYENPYFWQILLGISREAEASGYNLLLAHSSLTPEQESQSIRELAEQRVDGLVMLIGFKQLSDPVLRQLRASHRPVVVLTSTPFEFDYVIQGYGDGTRALMKHLLDFGHQRIGFILGVTTLSQGIDRLDAYRQALAEAGLPYDESLIQQCGEFIEDGYQAAYNLLSRQDRPTALLAINDLMGMAAIRAGADLGLRVPADLSVASFDDIRFTQFMVPRLTTVAGFPEEGGREAIRVLLRRMQEPQRPQEIVTVGWQLQIRESTGPAPR